MSVGARVRAPNVLRVEPFGAALFAGKTGKWLLAPAPMRDLLLGARGRSVFDAFYEDSGAHPYTEAELAVQAVDLQRAGLLDDAFALDARVVDDGRTAGTGAARAEPPSTALSAPLLTHVQLTRACNLKCTHCFVDVDSKPDPHELSTVQMRGLLQELSALGAPVVVLGGGEPMVRKDFWTIVDEVAAAGLHASLCTNGTMVTEEAAQRLAASSIAEYSISIDGPDEETHAKMRGPGRFEQAVAAVSRLAKAGVPEVQLRVTVTSTNIDRLVDFAEVAARSGAHKIAFKPFRRTETGAAHGHPQLDVDRFAYDTALQRARARWPSWAPPADFDDGVPERAAAWTRIMPEFACVGGTTSASVMYDGRVVSCGFVLDPRDWSLHQRSFAQCWREAPTIRAWRDFEGNTGCTTECGNFKKCGGGCRARATGQGGTLKDADPWADCALPTSLQSKKRNALPILTA